jgi:hypothetical protein
MNSDTYSNHVKNALQRLNLPVNKLCQFGRNIGSKYLDLMEVCAKEIRCMGTRVKFGLVCRCGACVVVLDIVMVDPMSIHYRDTCR